MPDILKVNGVGTASNLLKANGVALANLLKWNGVNFPSGVDADAITFINACHTAGHDLTANEQTYIDTLVKSLKSHSIWTKMIAIYPMIGGDAATVVINLKNPGTYKLTLVGSPTVSDNGIDWNGTSQYARTGIIPSSHLNLDDTHISYYSREDSAAGSISEMGAFDDGSGTNGLYFMMKYTGNFSHWRVNCKTTAIVANTDSRGLFIANRVDSSNESIFIRNSKTSSVTSSEARAGYEIYIGAVNITGYAYRLSSKECAFSTIGTGLSDSDADNLYDDVQAFQTSLSRNV